MFFKVSIYHLRTLWKKKLVKVLWIIQSKNMYVLVHNQPSQPPPPHPRKRYQMGIHSFPSTQCQGFVITELHTIHKTLTLCRWDPFWDIFFNMYLDTFVCLKTARAWNLSKHFRGQPVFLDPVWNARTPVCP